MNKKIGITEVVLRDGNQSLLSTRLKLDDILPIASKLDEVGYTSIESWGGAIFDSCVRYLDEDPWERLNANAFVSFLVSRLISFSNSD